LRAGVLRGCSAARTCSSPVCRMIGRIVAVFTRCGHTRNRAEGRGRALQWCAAGSPLQGDANTGKPLFTAVAPSVVRPKETRAQGCDVYHIPLLVAFIHCLYVAARCCVNGCVGVPLPEMRPRRAARASWVPRGGGEEGHSPICARKQRRAGSARSARSQRGARTRSR
jgi:hypothetical protein